MVNVIIALVVGTLCYASYRSYVVMKGIKRKIKEAKEKEIHKKSANLVYDEKTDSYVPEEKNKK